MASEENGASPMNLPSYEEAVSSPVYSPYPETCSCPGYEESVPYPPPPPPYSLRDRLPTSLQFPDSFWTCIGGLSKNTSEEETGNGNSELGTARCRCSLMEALGYTETASCPQCTNTPRQENPVCCQRGRQKQVLGWVFPCELQGNCPCSQATTGECKCEGGNTTTATTTSTTSSSPSSSSFSFRTRRFCHKVKEWLAV